MRLIEVTQQMAGYNPQDPVSIVAANFHDKKFNYAAIVQVKYEEGKKPVVKVGMGSLNPDGTPNTESIIENELEAEKARRAFGGTPMSAEEITDQIKNAQVNAQSLFNGVYTSFGLPMYEGINANNLITDGLNGLAVLSDEEFKSLISGKSNTDGLENN